jgi:hypothetical protein
VERIDANDDRERINKKIVAEFGHRELRSLKRDELQSFLDSKAAAIADEFL